MFPYGPMSPVRFRVFSMDPELQPNPEPILVTITVCALWDCRCGVALWGWDSLESWGCCARVALYGLWLWSNPMRLGWPYKAGAVGQP